MRVPQNHQVLAYGHDLDTNVEMLTIRVCDPNFPRNPDIKIRLGTGNPAFFRPIIHNANQTPIRGFFLSNYTTPAQPPA